MLPARLAGAQVGRLFAPAVDTVAHVDAAPAWTSASTLPAVS
jgi:hypothetical protein